MLFRAVRPSLSMVKKIFLGLILVAVVIQFFRPQKNLSAATPKTDLLVVHAAPPEVKQLLSVGCYDCHSDNTRYPWYAEIQPVAWWLASHVDDGKKELNFSSFGELSAKRKATRIEAMIDSITTGEMPLKSYTLVHRDAKFSPAQIKVLTDWLEALRDEVAPDK